MIDEIIRLVPSLQKGLNESALLGKNFDAPLVIGRIENCRLYVTCVEQGEMVQKMTNTYIPTIDTDVYVQLRKYDVSANSILAARSNGPVLSQSSIPQSTFRLISSFTSSQPAK